MNYSIGAKHAADAHRDMKMSDIFCIPVLGAMSVDTRAAGGCPNGFQLTMERRKGEGHFVRHLDTCTGIGGFLLAASWVWGPEHEIVASCEIDPYCRRVIAKHWPEILIVPDIRDFDWSIFRGTVDLFTSGPPCQPASHAGKRKGENDYRWLWPETLAVIEAVGPNWILCENPAGILSLGKSTGEPEVERKTLLRNPQADLFEKVFSRQEILLLGEILKNIEGLGYELARAIDGSPVLYCLPACAVNAPHRRDRVWIVASNSNGGMCNRRPDKQKRETERGTPLNGNSQAFAHAENQARADERIPILLQIPAAKRFVSIEPMLGSLDLTATPAGDILCRCDGCMNMTRDTRLDWVILGGETGPGARPMHPDWARSVRDQCVSAGVPYFHKQNGEWDVVYDRDKDDPDWGNCPKAKNNKERYVNLAGGHGFHGERVVFMRRVGKKAAGRLLDGREWNEVPE